MPYGINEIVLKPAKCVYVCVCVCVCAMSEPYLTQERISRSPAKFADTVCSGYPGSGEINLLPLHEGK